MQTPQHRLAIGDIAQRQRDMLLAGRLVKKTVHGKYGKGGGQPGCCNKNNSHRKLLALTSSSGGLYCFSRLLTNEKPACPD